MILIDILPRNNKWGSKYAVTFLSIKLNIEHFYAIVQQQQQQQ